MVDVVEVMTTDFYRGGSNLKPKLRELKIDRVTGLIKPIRGVSVYSGPDNLDRFGGAHRVTNVPDDLRIVQRGADPNHYEIIPARLMSLAEYEEALNKVILIPI